MYLLVGNLRPANLCRRWPGFGRFDIPIGLVSMWLSNRLLRDPDDFTRERIQAKLEGRMSIDGLGIVLITLASAALEICLDRGQIDDWFGSL